MAHGLYSTKYKLSGTNQFGYISVGDPYDAQNSRKKDRSSFKGKQFVTFPPKNGQTTGFFTGLSYAPEPYVDNTPYRILQPRAQRKYGFFSQDADRKGEFTNNLKNQQWREVIMTENKQNEKFRKSQSMRDLRNQKEMERKGDDGEDVSVPGIKSLNKSVSTRTLNVIDERDEVQKPQVADKMMVRNASAPHLFQCQVPDNLYDIGRDPAGITPFCNKCNRQKFFCPHRANLSKPVSAFRLGTYKTTNMVLGAGDVYSVAKPTHGARSETKYFFDHNHIGSDFADAYPAWKK